MYPGQPLKPSPQNPVAYSDKDIILFEGLAPDGRANITVVKKSRKTEPVEWWEPKDESSLVKRSLAIYKTPPSEILELLQSLSPDIEWHQLTPSPEPLNPYRYEGFFDGRSQVVELKPDLVNASDRTNLTLGLEAIVIGLLGQTP